MSVDDRIYHILGPDLCEPGLRVVNAESAAGADPRQVGQNRIRLRISANAVQERNEWNAPRSAVIVDARDRFHGLTPGRSGRVECRWSFDDKRDKVVEDTVEPALAKDAGKGGRRCILPERHGPLPLDRLDGLNIVIYEKQRN